MKNNIRIILPLVASALLMASCGGAQPSSSSIAPSSPTESSVSSAESSDEMVDIDDVAEIASGDYIYRKVILRLNKAEKKIKAIDYGNEYKKYKADQGTVQYEETIRFVKISGVKTIYYTHGEAKYYIQLKQTNYIAVMCHEGYSTSTFPMSLVPETVQMPVYGSYVSGELEHYKVDGEGKRIPSGDGGYEKEKFYLFIDISETSIKLYNGADATTHAETPLLSKDNYALLMNSKGVYVSVPHADPAYHLSLSDFGETSFRFVNAFEKHGDYSGEGTMTLIQE